MECSETIVIKDVEKLLEAIRYGTEEAEQDIYDIRIDIEQMWADLARKQSRRGDPTLWLQLKEFQRICPNLPPIRRG